MSYKIVDKNGSIGIYCSRCKLTSYSASDVKELFCGKCHAFHERLDVFIDVVPDRIITELYAWIVTDATTGPLEGIFGMSMGPGQELQAITSSYDTAMKVGNLIKTLPYRGPKQFKLVRFKRVEVVQYA